MPRHERLLRELERATATPNLAPEEDLSLIDEASSLSNGPGRSAMESEIDELLAGGHFGHIPSIPEEVQETTDDGLQVARGSQRRLLVENSAMTEEELLSDFEEVIWYLTPYTIPGRGDRCSASRLADNLFLTAAHCMLQTRRDIIQDDSPVQSSCVKAGYKHVIAAGWGGAKYDNRNDLAVITLNDPELWSGRTVQLSETCPQGDDIQRLIGWGDTGSIYCPRSEPAKQRSGLATVFGDKGITAEDRGDDSTNVIYTKRNSGGGDPNWNWSGVCGRDSGGFLGYHDEDSGQLSQTGVTSSGFTSYSKFAPVCEPELGDWVRSVVESGSSNWENNPNCDYKKYQEPLGPYGPMDMPLHGPVNEGRRAGKRELLSLQLPDEARQESFGSPMQSSNRGPGMAGMGLIIGIPLLLLILYLMNKFSRTKNTDRAQSEQN